MSDAPAAPTPRRSLAWARARRPELSQAVRMMAGVAVAFSFYAVLRLPQGYWAVFTVVIVTQGSIGGTLGAASDRMIGTVAGALVGGAAAALRPRTPLGLGAALVLCIGVTAYAAARSAKLKVAPVTAAIMLLSQSGGLSPEMAALYRVVEIAWGGVVGVLATVLVLPARSHELVVARAAAALERMADLLDAQAQAAAANVALPSPPEHVGLRTELAGVEAALSDAERERAARLAAHAIPAAVPRTLWRVRNDLVLIGRALQTPLPAPVAAALGPAAAALLQSEAALARRCAAALREVAPAPRDDIAARHDQFTERFEALRREGATRTLDFDAAGRVFGLAFTLESLHRDLADLADRVDEVATGRPARGRRKPAAGAADGADPTGSAPPPRPMRHAPTAASPRS